MSDELDNILEEFESKTPEKQYLGKIMIVDDNPIIVQALNDVFTRKGYETYCTDNGYDAVTNLNDKVGVVILDIKLPKINGNKVYRNLKLKHDVPIIFHSAYAGEDANDCINLEPFDYIHKGEKEAYTKLIKSVERALNE